MTIQYNHKWSQVLERLGQEPGELVTEFFQRFCAPPFSNKLGSVEIWLELWPDLSPEGRVLLSHMPSPCLNHVESRARKPERAKHLSLGLKRLLLHNEAHFLEGLRLYPHAVCRTAETIGPLNETMWQGLELQFPSNRLWQVEDTLSADEFWETAEHLEDSRELPQPILDFLALARPKDEAPLEDFMLSLQRFLLRKRIERIRSATHELLRGEREKRVIKVPAL